MTSFHEFSRRSFFALAAAPLAVNAARKPIPVGLELYSVRDELKKDLMGTVRQVAKIGYQCVEFYSPYTQWTSEYAKEVRKLLDDVGMRCYSTHNDPTKAWNLKHAAELNQIIGSKYLIMASAGKVAGLDGWKTVAEKLNRAAEELKPLGLSTGFHNHLTEFQPIDGKRPMEVLAENTHKSVVLQLDLGTCVEAGTDPVAWINSHPGRIRSMHCKDWAPGPDKGFKVLVGEGVVPWKKVIQAAQKTGGIEYYLIEQEGSTYSPMETAARCLANWRKLQNA